MTKLNTCNVQKRDIRVNIHTHTYACGMYYICRTVCSNSSNTRLRTRARAHTHTYTRYTPVWICFLQCARTEISISSVYCFMIRFGFSLISIHDRFLVDLSFFFLITRVIDRSRFARSKWTRYIAIIGKLLAPKLTSCLETLSSIVILVRLHRTIVLRFASAV